MAPSDKSAKPEEGPEPAVRPTCGIIMPISATVSHPEKHWAEVQVLLHRVINDAGFEPVNVWTGEVKDRISERSVGNLFMQDIVLADISDLNPNVMLELGLRLASKKPTLVIVNAGGEIPFDIRDFHAIHYPSNLNILGMEIFFQEVKESIQSKHAAFINKTYVPFLGTIVVDVLAPESRPVQADQLILSRLDALAIRLDRFAQPERPSEQQRTSSSHKVYVHYRNLSAEKSKSFEREIDAADGLLALPISATGGKGKAFMIDRDEGVGVGYSVDTIRGIAERLDIPSSDFTIANSPRSPFST